MSAENIEDLKNNMHQLDQIEIALSTEPDNADLLRLRSDLLEVISLLKDIITEEGGNIDEILDSTSNKKSEVKKNTNDKNQTPINEEEAIFKKKKKFTNEGLSHRERNKMEWVKRMQKQVKREEKQKELEQIKEKEKSSWQNFNNKANVKGLKGIKRVGSIVSAGESLKNPKISKSSITSTRLIYANNTFGNVARGNMDSLF
ncbi:Survival of motor neuron-related-splicing factor 30 [Strongyloides ratti]|uniref:Survival of motor neuron-related-splicing factor 30 n=1 Tax=Strongyloides ratti TaxID=34506 RepID=A0A090MXD7_STRRB|nr:Survival of motor neuron-related-splicing factor 30 [Strongyloides ratti]CEF65254.1 Survival of motor neuron-related-splicing factor 30 [Strongyloides ratti]